jgi:hypothetical protein
MTAVRSAANSPLPLALSAHSPVTEPRRAAIELIKGAVTDKDISERRAAGRGRRTLMARCAARLSVTANEAEQKVRVRVPISRGAALLLKSQVARRAEHERGHRRDHRQAHPARPRPQRLLAVCGRAHFAQRPHLSATWRAGVCCPTLTWMVGAPSRVPR